MKKNKIKNKIETFDVVKKFKNGDFEILITPFNLNMLNELLPKHVEVLYHNNFFWLRVKKKLKRKK